VLKEQGTSAGPVFMSMLSTLHLQMRATYFLLNCHSNFHTLLRM
jgi:hypothetical protein